MLLWGFIPELMKKLFIISCVAIGMLCPAAFNSTANAEPHERHEQIHEAIHALENARKHMKEAKHDFNGHREAALRACDEAIIQLRLALGSDRD